MLVMLRMFLEFFGVHFYIDIVASLNIEDFLCMLALEERKVNWNHVQISGY